MFFCLCRAKIQKQIEKDLAEMEAERKRRLKEKQMKKFIVEKAQANDQSVSLKASNKSKLREYLWVPSAICIEGCAQSKYAS